MKKTIFYISIIVSLIILINIIQILTTELERLTEYGFGYLIGKVVLFVVFSTAAILSRKYVIKKEETE